MKFYAVFLSIRDSSSDYFQCCTVSESGRVQYYRLSAAALHHDGLDAGFFTFAEVVVQLFVGHGETAGYPCPHFRGWGFSRCTGHDKCQNGANNNGSEYG
jgi:hypothetical protein